MRIAAALSIVAVIAVIAVGAVAAEPSGFAIGALRRDGVVIPFATYDGKHWSARWPPAEREPEIPINMRSVPSKWWGPSGPRETWQTWIDGRAAGTVRVLQPDAVDAHCVRQIGLRTDYRSAQPPAPPDEQPYPKDGLAVSPPQTGRGAGAPGVTIEPIEVIDRRAPQLNGLMTTLQEAFNRAERVTAGTFNHPVDVKIRERSEPQIEAVYAFGQAPRVYYIESVRNYRLPDGAGGFPFSDSRCGIAFGTGWFARDAGGFRSIEMSVRIVPCDSYGATYMLPFGAMHLGDRTYWIAQFSGWDHERYVVVDIGPKVVEAVVNAWGGGC